jgi:Periplasmic glucans biosynthesis protein
LLDSRRVAGAYRFVVTPGVETTMQVTARLYLRDKIGKLGLAPLTSMFAFGENQPGRDDFRPEVHDSDGLSVELGDGEWVWRPLVNPRRLLVTRSRPPIRAASA